MFFLDTYKEILVWQLQIMSNTSLFHKKKIYVVDLIFSKLVIKIAS